MNPESMKLRITREQYDSIKNCAHNFALINSDEGDLAALAYLIWELSEPVEPIRCFSNRHEPRNAEFEWNKRPDRWQPICSECYERLLRYLLPTPERPVLDRRPITQPTSGVEIVGFWAGR